MAAGLSDETRDAIVQTFEQLIPFNAVLGFEVGELTEERARVTIAMRPDLVGNPIKQSLHGGVISATLDAAGGMVAIAAVLSRSRLSEVTRAKIFERLGTIDLRVDYLRPARGGHFDAVAYPMRVGGTVAVTRMEFHDHETGALLAVGTGTYMVG